MSIMKYGYQSNMDTDFKVTLYLSETQCRLPIQLRDLRGIFSNGVEYVPEEDIVAYSSFVW